MLRALPADTSQQQAGDNIGVATRRGSKASEERPVVVAEESAVRPEVITVDSEAIHVTRRRSGSIIKKPRHLDSPSPSPPPPTLHPSPPRRPSAVPSATVPSSSLPQPISISIAPIAPPLVTLASLASAPPSQTPRPHSRPTQTLSSDSLPSSDYPHDERRHPRDLVPRDIGFPTPAMEGRIKAEDLEDRLLMATCAVMHTHENRALCPKEVAQIMFERGWLHNAGTTPFAHVSTCIRSHLRRASIAVPPYPPIFTSFELVGALTAYEVRAVGLRSEERPAVKRGTLWYLDERVLGKGVGAEDPFIRCRREAGLGPSEVDGVYVRGLPPPVVAPSTVVEDDEDDSGMGRGKRKRKASSAAIAALVDPTVVPALPSPLAIPSTASKNLLHPGHRRMSSTGASASAPAKSAAFVPKLRLRLTSLEEVDSMDDSDGQTSDAQRRRKTKKKARRAASEGGVGMSRAGSTTSGRSFDDMEDDDDQVGRLPAFSSASSSALLAQSLLAASSASSPSHPPTSSQSVVSPNSLHHFPSTNNSLFQQRPAPHHLSVSAPNLFSAFPSARSPDSMDVDSNDFPSHHGDDLDSGDEDDYHEAMLRGEDFDFEWGSESYTTGLSVPPPFSASQTKSSAKGKGREPSAGLGELFDQRDETDGDGDATSTPATTPRSPPGSKEEEWMDPPPPCGRGMQATLCEGFGQEIKEEESDVERFMSDRATSTDSLTSLVLDEFDDEEPVIVTRDADDPSALSVPLPSPLALELPPLLPLSNAFSPDYDFVGHEEDDRSAYRNQYDRDMAESADDEDEDDDIVTVKIEDEGSVEPGSVTSSRQSSAYPMIESFSRRLQTEKISSSSDSASSDSDAFDPHQIDSNSVLASGLPVPQVAPSPPETMEWGTSLDMDDLDIELGSGVDLLGPESVGLEELDLAWGGPVEQGEYETDDEWRMRTEAVRVSVRGFGGRGSTFLTGSPLEGFTPVISPECSVQDLRAAPVAPSAPPAPPAAIPVVVDPPPVVRPDPPPVGTAPKPATTVCVYPKIPLVPLVTATVVEAGVPVYATDVVDPETRVTYPLLRTLDADFVNATVLLRGLSSNAGEREAVLATIGQTFKVTSPDSRIEGHWISLPTARRIMNQFPALRNLATFLDEDLGTRFPDPLPSLRGHLQDSLRASRTAHGAFGFPVFTDLGSKGAQERSISPRSVPQPAPSSVAKKGVGRPKGRRSSTASGAKVEARDSSPEVIGVATTTAAGRKTRRSLAAKG